MRVESHLLLDRWLWPVPGELRVSTPVTPVGLSQAMPLDRSARRGPDMVSPLLGCIDRDVTHNMNARRQLPPPHERASKVVPAARKELCRRFLHILQQLERLRSRKPGGAQPCRGPDKPDSKVAAASKCSASARRFSRHLGKCPPHASAVQEDAHGQLANGRAGFFVPIADFEAVWRASIGRSA